MAHLDLRPASALVLLRFSFEGSLETELLTCQALCPAGAANADAERTMERKRTVSGFPASGKDALAPAIHAAMAVAPSMVAICDGGKKTF